MTKANIPLRIRNLARRLELLEQQQQHREEQLRTLERMLENQRLQLLLAFDRLAQVLELLAGRGHYRRRPTSAGASHAPAAAAAAERRSPH